MLSSSMRTAEDNTCTARTGAGSDGAASAAATGSTASIGPTTSCGLLDSTAASFGRFRFWVCLPFVAIAVPADFGADRGAIPPALYRNESRNHDLRSFAISVTRSSGSGASKLDRKSTRLNSSHVEISYAVFCLKKKTKQTEY